MIPDDNLSAFTEPTISGRYITNDSIALLIEKHSLDFNIEVVGKSVLSKNIVSIRGGRGKIKILMWSQMHGNESTTTKAVFDLLNYIRDNPAILDLVEFCIIPILNPDGAESYIRENANGIDLNRDFVNLSQPESRLLMDIFNDFKPDYCFNLHDQRTIYGAGASGKPATVSFLAPAYNEARDINPIRSKAKEIIAVMNDALQLLIPDQVGRFDDAFNINCAGDMFQARSVPTILFEAGHFPEDYSREKTRYFIFLALVTAVKYIATNSVIGNRNEDYSNIPQNKIDFYDFVYRNVKINYENKEIITNFASQYIEELLNSEIVFTAVISEIGDLKGYFGHNEYDADHQLYRDNFQNAPQIGQKAEFKIGDAEFVNGMPVNKL